MLQTGHAKQPLLVRGTPLLSLAIIQDKHKEKLGVALILMSAIQDKHKGNKIRTDANASQTCQTYL